ncbi:MAG: GNAT family N-acetyltransferase [Rikenellaceae bacterium]
MKIRKAMRSDIGAVMAIFDYARKFMQMSGNGSQWGAGYPSESIIMRDIECGNSYVCTADNGEIVATFCFVIATDSTYNKIYNGKWLNDNPYGVVHRLAKLSKVGGVANFCLQWCFEQCENIRVDTHKDNIIMQNIFKQNGYVECGTIIIEDGSFRTAFQKTKTL